MKKVTGKTRELTAMARDGGTFQFELVFTVKEETCGKFHLRSTALKIEPNEEDRKSVV